jgi:DnaD/phage-associated family protein
MPTLSFLENFAMYDVTPIENLFLLEYMPHAPGDYVRVYLYGLMLCYHPDGDASIDDIARVLNMKADTVLDALRYWEQKGAVIGMSENPPTYRYINLRTAISRDRADEDEMYAYKQFNAALQAVFGSDKLLHPQEYQKAMEWVEELKLSRETVLTLLKYKVAAAKEGGKSLRNVMRDADKDALNLARMNLLTAEDAEMYLQRETARYKLCRAVLLNWNIRRAPTMAELEMGDKWLDMGLSVDAVLRVQKEAVKSAHPSFAYLDGIVKNISFAPDAEAALTQGQRRFDGVKQILKSLGNPSQTPTPEQIELSERLIDEGMPPEVLQKAAAQCGLQNKRSFVAFERTVKKWKSLKLLTLDAVNAYAQRREEAYLVLEKSGQSRRPSEADVDQLIKWQKELPMELILYAAECASGTQLPIRYIDKTLTEWAERHVATVEDAKRERAAHAPQSAAKELPAQKYAQRTYDDDALAHLTVDITKLPEGDGE